MPDKPQYLLLTYGYEPMICPFCDTLCYPDAMAANGDIIYTRHYCRPAYSAKGHDRRFEIDVNGRLVE